MNGWMHEPFAGSFFLYDSRAARPSARPASAVGSGAVNGEDRCGMASGVSAMQTSAAYQQLTFTLTPANAAILSLHQSCASMISRSIFCGSLAFFLKRYCDGT